MGLFIESLIESLWFVLGTVAILWCWGMMIIVMMYPLVWWSGAYVPQRRGWGRILAALCRACRIPREEQTK